MDGILPAEYSSGRSHCWYAARTLHPVLIFAWHGCLDHRSATSEMLIAQQPAMVSALDNHPMATVVVALIATVGKALAGNFIAGVTPMTLMTMKCGWVLDRGASVLRRLSRPFNLTRQTRRRSEYPAYIKRSLS